MIKRKNILRSIGFSVILMVMIGGFGLSSVVAAPPSLINYQGRLRDADSDAITAATTIQFSIYNHATTGASTDAASEGGALLWKETYNAGSGACAEIDPDAEGYFTVQLGTCSAFPSYLDFTQTTLYIGIKIESDSEAAPRARLAAHPYSLNSSRIGNFVDTGSNTLRGEALGTATVGTQGYNSPQILLQGSGWTGAAAADREFKLQNTVTDASTYRFSLFNNADAELFTILGGGNVGIGDATPVAGLDVQTAVTAADGIFVKGVQLQQSLTAVANSDVLSPLFINPTYDDNGKTSVTHDLATFVAVSNAATTISIDNSSGGAAAITGLSIVNDSVGAFDFLVASSAFSGNTELTNAGVIRAGSTLDGIVVGAESATGTINFYTGGTIATGTLRLLVAADGKIGVGDATPDYNLEITGTQPNFALSSSDVAHGVTDLAQTDAYFLIQPEGTVAGGGGATVAGISDDAGQAGLNLIGLIGVADPTDTTPAIALQAMKKSGTGGQALGAAETVFGVMNYTTDVMTILGNGNVGIGDTTPVAPLTVATAPTGVVDSYLPGVQFDQTITATGNYLLAGLLITPTFVDNGNTPPMHAGVVATTDYNGTFSQYFKNDSTGTSAVNGVFIASDDSSYTGLYKYGSNHATPGLANASLLYASNDLFVQYNGTNTAKSLYFMSASTIALTVDSFGKVGIGDITPDYLFELGSASLSADPIFVLSDADVAHGRTGLVQTDVFGEVTSISTTAGGLLVRGVSDAVGATAAIFEGTIGSADPTDTTTAVMLRGQKADGTTGVASLGADETVLGVYNYTSGLLTILGDGRTGIGDTTPGYQLEVADDAAGTYVANFFNDGNDANRYGLRVQAGADDGTTGTTYYLDAYDGDGTQIGYIANTTGTFALTDPSDIRTKTNVTDTTWGGLEIVNQLRVVDYNRLQNPDGPRITGFIAQEAQPVFPNMVNEGANGILGITKDSLIPILVKAVQEQQAQLEALQFGRLGLTLSPDLTAGGTLELVSQLAFGVDTVGQAVIQTNDERVSITFEQTYGYMPIVTVTPVGLFGGTYAVENVTFTGFDIVVADSVMTDITFGWHAFGAKQGKVYSSDGSVTDLVMPVVDSSPAMSGGGGGSAPTEGVATPTETAEEPVVVDATLENDTSETGTSETVTPETTESSPPPADSTNTDALAESEPPAEDSTTPTEVL